LCKVFIGYGLNRGTVFTVGPFFMPVMEFYCHIIPLSFAGRKTVKFTLFIVHSLSLVLLPNIFAEIILKTSKIFTHVSYNGLTVFCLV
jgi:hypothetical protein